jgi:hypothetical protein
MHVRQEYQNPKLSLSLWDGPLTLLVWMHDCFLPRKDSLGQWALQELVTTVSSD